MPGRGLSFEGGTAGWTGRGDGEVEGEGDFPCGEEVAYVRHVFIFHADKVPHETTEYFPEGDEERCCRAVLLLSREHNVEQP